MSAPHNASMLTDLTSVDLGSREPISSEITRRLLDFLMSGKVQPGSRLPSERKLAEALGVGRSHVRQAIKSEGGIHGSAVILVPGTAPLRLPLSRWIHSQASV